MTAIAQTKQSTFNKGHLSLLYSGAVGFVFMGGLMHTLGHALRMATIMQGTDHSVMTFAPDVILPTLITVGTALLLSNKAYALENAHMQEQRMTRTPHYDYSAQKNREAMLAIGLLAGFAAGAGYIGLVVEPQIQAITTAQVQAQTLLPNHALKFS